MLKQAFSARTGSRTFASKALVVAAGLLLPGLALAQSRPTLQGLQDQVTALQRATNCLALPTTEVNLPDIGRGAYLANGSHLANIPFLGQFMDGATVRGPYRNYIAYDLRHSQLLNREDLVVAAELITYNKSVPRDGTDGFKSDTTDTLAVVLNRAAWMSNDGVAAMLGGTAGAAGFVDLADGPVYAQYVASAAINGSQFNIRLSEMAIRDLNRANGGMADNSGRLLFAIGGMLQMNGASGNAYLFGAGVPYATLAVKVRRYQGTGCPMPVGTEYQ